MPLGQVVGAMTEKEPSREERSGNVDEARDWIWSRLGRGRGAALRQPRGQSELRS